MVNPENELIDEASFGTKRDVAKMLKMSIRSVDNFLARGCPVIKLSPRCCRFDLAEVKNWFKQQYGERRLKAFASPQPA